MEIEPFFVCWLKFGRFGATKHSHRRAKLAEFAKIYKL